MVPHQIAGECGASAAAVVVAKAAWLTFARNSRHGIIQDRHSARRLISPKRFDSSRERSNITRLELNVKVVMVVVVVVFRW